MKKIVFLLLLTFFVASCSSAEPIPDSADSIVYRYDDSSVPPEFHRSYTITITPSEATVVVDVYGDILAEESVGISAETFQAIKTSFETNEISSGRQSDEPACTGGTGEGIAYSSAGENLFSGYVYHCGSSDSGNLYGDTASFASDVKALIPNLQDLLNLPYAEPSP